MNFTKLTLTCAHLVLTCSILTAAGGGGGERKLTNDSYISENAIPFLYEKEEDDPGRNLPFFGLGLGDRFLGNGNLYPGFTLPGGAVWQPRLWFYGNSRTSLGTYDLGNNRPKVSEWATRFNLFANLQLTGTERILIGIEPFHRGNQFLGEVFEPDTGPGFTNPTNARIRTLFFEGDLAELIPMADVNDSKGLDIGFSIGRQLISFQDGLLINDTIDGIGLTKNNLRFNGVDWLTNLRITLFRGWDEVNRDDNVLDKSSKLTGLFTAVDTVWSTIELDIVFVESSNKATGDLLSWGVGNTMRLFEQFNWTFRALGSNATDNTTRQSDDGHLLFTEFSITPHGTHDVLYLNAFAGFDQFSSSARGELSGGPLGRTGILFAARGVGTYPSPFSNRAREAFGSAIGYQYFFAQNKQHIVVETGFRKDTSNTGPDHVGLGAQWQVSFFDNYIFQLDSFVRGGEGSPAAYGTRSEFQIKF